MKKVKTFESDDNCISVSASQPTIDGQIQPLELLFVVKQGENEDFILTFRKDEAKKIFRQMKKAIEMIENFG